MIRVHGVVGSRTLRTLWMLEELGAPYEQVPTHFRDGGTRTPAHLSVNPNARIPALEDGSLKLFESMAINLYLAMKYNHGLWPATIEDQARAIQWSIWGMTEVEPNLLTALLNRAVFPPERRDDAKAQAAVEALQKPLQVLEDALKGRTQVVGESFSVADLNLAALLSWVRGGKVDLAPYPNLQRWLTACLARPAFKAAQGKQ